MLNNKEKEYLRLLFKQYCEALGSKYQNVSLDNQFVDWILERKKIGEQYYSQLKELDLNSKIEEYNTIEVNKGKYDSVVDKTDMTIITPYTDNFNRDGKILTGNFEINYSIPTFVTQNAIFNISLLKDFRIMTHNPYHIFDIDGWEKLPNQGYNEILIGVFGKTYDKDYNDKIKHLQHIEQLIRSNTLMDFFTINDSYIGYVASNSSQKKLVKTLVKTRD